MARSRIVRDSPHISAMRPLERKRHKALVNSVQQDKRAILFSYLQCESRSEANAWERETRDRVIEIAEPLPQTIGFSSSERAYCPLCGYGGALPYASGYAVPIGLYKHLTGTGRAQRCEVFASTLALASESFDEKFAAFDREEEKQRAAKIALLRQTGTLYKLKPDGEPCLLEDGLSHLVEKPRDEAGLAWAEQRLASLGFQVVVDGRVKSYINVGATHLVYADPRRERKIIFHVYRPPLVRAARVAGIIVSKDFKMEDAWKLELGEKYKRYVAEALTEVGPSTRTSSPLKRT